MREAFINSVYKPAFESVLAILCVCSLGVFMTGCEDSDTIGGKIIDAVDGSDKNDTNLSGTWNGISGSGHYSTVVSISDKNGSLSGSLRWSWGGTRKFSGSRSGKTVEWSNQPDEHGVVDHWQMTLSSDGNHLSGRASKTDGGSYSISLSR